MSNEPWDDKRAALQTSIKQIRIKKGLTQFELASSLEKPQSYISKYENGERKLDYVELRAICTALGVSISSFDRMYRSNVKARDDWLPLHPDHNGLAILRQIATDRLN